MNEDPTSRMALEVILHWTAPSYRAKPYLWVVGSKQKLLVWGNRVKTIGLHIPLEYTLDNYKPQNI